MYATILNLEYTQDTKKERLFPRLKPKLLGKLKFQGDLCNSTQESPKAATETIDNLRIVSRHAAAKRQEKR